MNIKEIKNIIWDWNGTLLNDVDLCIESMNQLLKPRELDLLSKDRYQEVFTFPVQNYYEKIGIDFDKDPFDTIGHQFMDLYFQGLSQCQLFEGVRETLAFFKKNGIRQFVLSAMEHQALKRALEDYGISEYFEAVYGIDNHLAAGKMDRGRQLMEENAIKPFQSIIIGDTLHDLEVALQLQSKIVLIANGHQSEAVLNKTGGEVYKSLQDFMRVIEVG